MIATNTKPTNKNPPSNQSMAALAEGGSSKDTVASPFSFPVSLSVYRFIMGKPVFLFSWVRESKRERGERKKKKERHSQSADVKIQQSAAINRAQAPSVHRCLIDEPVLVWECDHAPSRLALWVTWQDVQWNYTTLPSWASSHVNWSGNII